MMGAPLKRRVDHLEKRETEPGGGAPWTRVFEPEGLDDATRKAWLTEQLEAYAGQNLVIRRVVDAAAAAAPAWKLPRAD